MPWDAECFESSEMIPYKGKIKESVKNPISIAYDHMLDCILKSQESSFEKFLSLCELELDYEGYFEEGNGAD